MRFLTKTLVTAAVIAGATCTPALGDSAPVPPPAPCLNVIGLVSICPPAVPPTPPPAPPAPPAPASPPAPSAPQAKATRGCKNATLRPNASNLAWVANATLCLVNRARVKHGLHRLKRQATLDQAARAYAARLVAERFFAHTTPDGWTMLARLKSTGYLAHHSGPWSLGENIAYGTGPLAPPAAIVRSWMASPDHRANILRPEYRQIGLGVVLGSPFGPDGATYVHDFGRRSR